MTTVFVLLFFASCVQADATDYETTTIPTTTVPIIKPTTPKLTPSPTPIFHYNSLSEETITQFLLFDVEEELEKISAYCLTINDFEELSGNIVKGPVAKKLKADLIPASIQTIALTELRATLKFDPIRPWVKHNEKNPSAQELKSATFGPYYNLKEPRSVIRSLDAESLFESNIPPAVNYWDKKFPAIRIIFRRKFEKVRRSYKGKRDKKLIDKLINEYHSVLEKVNESFRESENNYECWKKKWDD